MRVLSGYRSWELYVQLKFTVAKENVAIVYYALLISTSFLPIILTYMY
jgi:hypothetical protein